MCRLPCSWAVLSFGDIVVRQTVQVHFGFLGGRGGALAVLCSTGDGDEPKSGSKSALVS